MFLYARIRNTALHRGLKFTSINYILFSTETRNTEDSDDEQVSLEKDNIVLYRKESKTSNENNDDDVGKTVTEEKLEKGRVSRN